MSRTIYVVLVGLVFCSLGMSGQTAAQKQELQESPQTLLIADLEPKLDGQDVTIQFTVTGLEGIAQLAKEGQAPTFAIETEKGKQKNELSVWIEGELANVLNRLQLAAFQDNALKAGTVIVASGKLSKHKSIPNLYFLNVSKWQDFRILPKKEEL